MNRWTLLATLTFIAVFTGSYHLLTRSDGPTDSEVAVPDEIDQTSPPAAPREPRGLEGDHDKQDWEALDEDEDDSGTPTEPLPTPIDQKIEEISSSDLEKPYTAPRQNDNSKDRKRDKQAR